MSLHRNLLVLLAIIPLTAIAESPPTDGVATDTKPRVKGLNPDVSANFLGLIQHGTGFSNNRTAPPYNGLSIQESEIQFTSDVDPYLRASALFAFGQESGTTEFTAGMEEIYFETIALPSITFRAGKFKLSLGKHNQLHAHGFPFIDAPLTHRALLGDEGLNETAISAAALLPFSWYSEIILQGYSPSNETLFLGAAPDVGSRNSGDFGGLVRLKNLFDLNDDLTLEIGASGTRGQNQFGFRSQVYGGDLTFKWRPSEGGKYHALVFSSEYLNGRRPGSKDSAGDETEKLGGVATWVQYQFSQRWWIQWRNERFGLPRSPAIAAQNKQSGLIGFFPSEFSGFRFQYDYLKTLGAAGSDHTFALQYNVSIGAHPAHTY